MHAANSGDVGGARVGHEVAAAADLEARDTRRVLRARFADAFFAARAELAVADGGVGGSREGRGRGASIDASGVRAGRDACVEHADVRGARVRLELVAARPARARAARHVGRVRNADPQTLEVLDHVVAAGDFCGHCRRVAGDGVRGVRDALGVGAVLPPRRSSSASYSPRRTRPGWSCRTPPRRRARTRPRSRPNRLPRHRSRCRPWTLRPWRSRRSRFHRSRCRPWQCRRSMPPRQHPFPLVELPPAPLDPLVPSSPSSDDDEQPAATKASETGPKESRKERLFHRHTSRNTRTPTPVRAPRTPRPRALHAQHPQGKNAARRERAACEEICERVRKNSNAIFESVVYRA